MLVLTRKYQEKIRIGENITITVLRTKGKAVRLGIEAPSDVPVIRGELAFEADSIEIELDETTDEVANPLVGSHRTEPSSWVAESPRNESRERSPQVELNRVPRSEVRNFLPKLASGTAPLRAMMSQRV